LLFADLFKLTISRDKIIVPYYFIGYVGDVFSFCLSVKVGIIKGTGLQTYNALQGKVTVWRNDNNRIIRTASWE
jgi:hypothetical protein